jgi:hypothetical protein
VADADLSVGGSSEGHLALEASPRPVDAATILFHGGPKYLRAMGASEIWGVTGWWYLVLGESLFTQHLVLVWTWGGHTYAVGFHTGTSDSRRFGLAVARNLVLVPPP